MKKQIILSLVVVFALALFAPAVAQAINNDSKIVLAEVNEKDEVKKTDEKKTKSTATKKESTAAKSTCTEKKAACCSEKKAECSESKTEKK